MKYVTTITGRKISDLLKDWLAIGFLRYVIYRSNIVEDYYVDTSGYIYSTKRDDNLHLLSICKGDKCNPYPKVGININKKSTTVSVHRLVCESFHPKPLPNILTEEQWKTVPVDVRNTLLDHITHADRYQVNHIDHDINNFHPSNLEWVTTIENQQKYQEHRKKLLAETNELMYNKPELEKFDIPLKTFNEYF